MAGWIVEAILEKILWEILEKIHGVIPGEISTLKESFYKFAEDSGGAIPVGIPEKNFRMN